MSPLKTNKHGLRSQPGKQREGRGGISSGISSGSDSERCHGGAGWAGDALPPSAVHTVGPHPIPAQSQVSTSPSHPEGRAGTRLVPRAAKSPPRSCGCRPGPGPPCACPGAIETNEHKLEGFTQHTLTLSVLGAESPAVTVSAGPQPPKVLGESPPASSSLRQPWACGHVTRVPPPAAHGPSSVSPPSATYKDSRHRIWGPPG